MDLLTIRKCQPAGSNIAAGKTAHDAKAQAKPQEVRGYVDLGQAADRLHGTETALEDDENTSDLPRKLASRNPSSGLVRKRPRERVYAG